jgi:hypothetical protein
MIYLLFLLVWAPIGAILNGTAIQLCWKFFLAPVFQTLARGLTYYAVLFLSIAIVHALQP